MIPLDGSKDSLQGLGLAIRELQWSHETLMRLIEVVNRNGLAGDELKECVVTMAKASVLLEGLIQAHLAYARRRRDD